MPPKTKRISKEAALRVVVERAARGLGKVARDPKNGAANVTFQEVEAMAAMLQSYGMKPIGPGKPSPEDLQVDLPNGWRLA